MSRRSQEIFSARYLPHVRPCPGAQDLLKHMRSQGLKLAVASSAQKDELEPLLRVAGAKDMVTGETSSDDADHSKPDPDIVQAALETLKMKPAECVMLGDTPYDVEAARRAGVPVIAVRSGGWDDASLAGAVAIYDDPADLLAHYAESPLSK